MKFVTSWGHAARSSRPRKGAWIEIMEDIKRERHHHRRPRKGAWIEIASGGIRRSAPMSPPQGGVD